MLLQKLKIKLLILIVCSFSTDLNANSAVEKNEITQYDIERFTSTTQEVINIWSKLNNSPDISDRKNYVLVKNKGRIPPFYHHETHYFSKFFIPLVEEYGLQDSFLKSLKQKGFSSIAEWAQIGDRLYFAAVYHNLEIINQELNKLAEELGDDNLQGILRLDPQNYYLLETLDYFLAQYSGKIDADVTVVVENYDQLQPFLPLLATRDPNFDPSSLDKYKQ